MLSVSVIKETIMNKKLLSTKELFQRTIKQLEENKIFVAIRGDDIYLIQSETGQRHKIKIGQLEISAKKYNQSCDLDWNQEFKDYWK